MSLGRLSMRGLGLKNISQTVGGAGLWPGGWSPMSLTNGDGTAITYGQVCYISAADTARKGQANSTQAIATVRCMCIDTTVAAGVAGRFVFGGRIPVMTGLTAATDYFLSTTLGALTVTPNITVGQYLVYVGFALSITEFQLVPSLPILN